MKLILPVVVAALGFSGSMIYAQEQPLTEWPTQDGQNVQVGQLACSLTVQGLNIRDNSGNLTASIPLLSDPTQTPVQLGDTLYALIPPPDANGQATALIMYQTVASTSEEVNKAVQDALYHNNWFNASFAQPRLMTDADQPLPVGTQFWVCSSSGFVTFASDGAIFAVGSQPPGVDPSDPAVAGLTSLTNSTTTSNPSTTATPTTTP
jgi:hypothetical protein